MSKRVIACEKAAANAQAQSKMLNLEYSGFCSGHALVLYVYLTDPDEDNSAVLTVSHNGCRLLSDVSIADSIVLPCSITFRLLAPRGETYLENSNAKPVQYLPADASRP